LFFFFDAVFVFFIFLSFVFLFDFLVFFLK